MSKKEYILETTKEKQAEMKARGINEDAIPAVGKQIFRRVDPNKVAARKEQKIKITMYLDADILDFFKERAKKPDASPYQTQINNELRAVMEGKENYSKSETVKTEMLNDPEFISALAEKLKAA